MIRTLFDYLPITSQVFTNGSDPYKHIVTTKGDADDINNQIRIYVQNGGRLLRPSSCDDQVYMMMQRCWSVNRKDRPSFAELAKFFRRGAGKHGDDERLSDIMANDLTENSGLEKDRGKGHLNRKSTHQKQTHALVSIGEQPHFHSSQSNAVTMAKVGQYTSILDIPGNRSRLTSLGAPVSASPEPYYLDTTNSASNSSAHEGSDDSSIRSTESQTLSLDNHWDPVPESSKLEAPLATSIYTKEKGYVVLKGGTFKKPYPYRSSSSSLLDSGAGSATAFEAEI